MARLLCVLSLLLIVSLAQPIQLFTTGVTGDPSSEALQGGGCIGEQFEIPSSTTWFISNVTVGLECVSCTNAQLAITIYHYDNLDQTISDSGCGSLLYPVATQSFTPNTFIYSPVCVISTGTYFLGFDQPTGPGAISLGYNSPTAEPGDIGILFTADQFCFSGLVLGGYHAGDSLSDVALLGSTTEAPTLAPSLSPTPAPSPPPTVAPTPAPTTVAPTRAPTVAPTRAPTIAPTVAPTRAPTVAPTPVPLGTPTNAPTSPTAAPTEAPTTAPTRAPTTAPTVAPTAEPTTGAPTSPTAQPTTGAPTLPTASPTASPVPTGQIGALGGAVLVVLVVLLVVYIGAFGTLGAGGAAAAAGGLAAGGGGDGTLEGGAGKRRRKQI